MTSDLSAEREVRREEGQQFAREHSLVFMETSAKDATNVESAFVEMTKDIYNQVEKGIIEIEQVIVDQIYIDFIV